MSGIQNTYNQENLRIRILQYGIYMLANEENFYWNENPEHLPTTVLHIKYSLGINKNYCFLSHYDSAYVEYLFLNHICIKVK